MNKFSQTLMFLSLSISPIMIASAQSRIIYQYDGAGNRILRNVSSLPSKALLYATNRALAALGTELNINFAHAA